MGKKTIPGSQIGYPIVIGGEYSPPQIPDNNPDGVMKKPDYSSDPSAGNYGKNKFDFAGLVGKGESPNVGDVNVITPNGIASSKGQGNNCQYNWWKGNSGIWNKNKEWDGGNRTGE